MENLYQIFGSESSEDLDVMVFVDEIPSTIEESKDLCHFWNEKIESNKKVNSNLAVLKDGIIIDIYKGCSCECNNSLYNTYKYHIQKYPLQIERLVERDIDLKIMRSARSILMILSRSQFRIQIKNALRSDFIKKIQTLEYIDYSVLTEDDIRERIDFKDALKQISFQLGQSIALMDGVELYTKEDVSNMFPSLEDMLLRKEPNLIEIEKYKNEFVRKSKLRLKNMKTFIEYKK